MPTVYFLRHCDYDNPRSILPGRLPLPLSAAGRERAHELQQFFSDKQIGVIYSSAVQRCKETAEIIAQTTIPIKYDKRLLETLSACQGYWGESQTAAGFEAFLHLEELGGETLQDIKNRMVNFWHEIASSLTENSIICSHGDPLMVLYHYLKQIPLPDDVAAPEVRLPGWLEKGAFNVHQVYNTGS